MFAPNPKKGTSYASRSWTAILKLLGKIQHLSLGHVSLKSLANLPLRGGGLLANSLVLLLALYLLVGAGLVIWPKGPIKLLIDPNDWQNDGQFASVAGGTKLELPTQVLRSSKLRLWIGSLHSGGAGTLATLTSKPFDPPVYLGIPHYGFPGERPGNRIFLRCAANGRELDVATVRTNNQWATEYLAIPFKFCADDVQLVATVTTSTFLVGIGTPFAVSRALYYAQTAFPVRALIVFGTWIVLLGLVGSIGYSGARLFPGTDALAAGFVGLGSIAMALFLAFHFAPAVGHWISVLLAIGGVSGLVLVAVVDQPGFRRLLSEYGTAVLYWLVVAMTYSAFISSIDNGGGSWAINGMFTPLRWSSDNQLPFLFAEAMYDGTPRETIGWGPWLASDRTPLLAALLLIVRSALIEPLVLSTDSTIISTAYVLAGIVILSSWTTVLYQLCRRIGGADVRFVMVLAVTSPFFFFNTVYTWPKMLGATYVLLAAYTLMQMRKAPTPNGADLTIAALCASLAYLSHASNGFALIPVGLVFAGTIFRQGLVRIAIATSLATIVALPWLWWQTFVQPGGTALLRAALAGGLGFEDRGGPIVASIRNAYDRLGLDGWIAIKLQGMQLILGWPAVRLGEVAPASPGLGPLGAARVQDFFLLSRGIGIAVVGLPLFLAGFILRSQTNSRTHWEEVGYVALAGSAGILLVLLISLQTQITHVHAYGSIALVFLAGALGIVKTSRSVAVCALVLSSFYFGLVWLGHPLWIALRISSSALVAFVLGLVALVVIWRNIVATPSLVTGSYQNSRCPTISDSIRLAAVQRQVRERTLGMVDKRVVFYVGGVLVIALASFWLVSKILNHPVEGDPVSKLSELSVHDASELREAAGNAGLRESSAMVGWVNGAIHESDGRLTLRGWAADGNGNGDPIKVIMFANGKAVLTAIPKGPRDEVQKVWTFPAAVASNVDVNGVSKQAVPCAELTNVIVVSVNSKGEFGILGGGFPLRGC